MSILAFQQKSYPFINEKIEAFSYASLYYEYPTIEPSVFSPKTSFPLSVVTMSPSVALTGVISIQSNNHQNNNDILFISLGVAIIIILFFVSVAYKLRLIECYTWNEDDEISIHSDFGITLDNISLNDSTNMELL
jgi:phosphate starvation-inducible membrane PsiE